MSEDKLKDSVVNAAIAYLATEDLHKTFSGYSRGGVVPFKVIGMTEREWKTVTLQHKKELEHAVAMLITSRSPCTEELNRDAEATTVPTTTCPICKREFTNLEPGDRCNRVEPALEFPGAVYHCPGQVRRW